MKELTKRQIEILDLLAQGFRKKEIARKLVIAQPTVTSHLCNIYNKLGIVADKECDVRILAINRYKEGIINKIKRYCNETIQAYDNGNYSFEDTDYYKGRAGIAEEILDLINE